MPALRAAIAEHQRSRYGLEHDPDTEVQVTFGATEAIAAALLGLCDPGDEVIALDPTYDSYAAGVALAGARLRRVPLHPPDWRFDPAELAAAVTDRARGSCCSTRRTTRPAGARPRRARGGRRASAASTT